MSGAAPFSGLRAQQRAEALLDAGSFRPLTESTAEMPLVAGSGLLFGVPIVVALTDGHVRGGTIGVREAGCLAALADSAADSRRAGRQACPVLIGFDTGGVRVEEGPRALAAASAVGVALARLTLTGVPLAAVISGPRGCFGAPAVMAALPQCVIMTDTAHWGLTGPKLISSVSDRRSAESDGFAATSAATRLGNGDAHAVVPDFSDAIREALRRFITASPTSVEVTTIEQQLSRSADITTSLWTRLRDGVGATAAVAPSAARRRDLLRYSLRGQWKPTGPIRRAGLIHAAFGTLAGRPALGFILEAEPAYGTGVGIEEAAVVADMIRDAATHPVGPRAAILTFLFCQGHAVDLVQERFGLPRALAECLRAMAAARLLGHPIVSVLGGGTYGAAYLALAAPSHRILALRGTSIAPMAPHVLQAFQALRGFKSGQEAATQLAELIPGIRMVESVVRLPRVLREELTALRDTVRAEV